MAYIKFYIFSILPILVANSSNLILIRHIKTTFIVIKKSICKTLIETIFLNSFGEFVF